MPHPDAHDRALLEGAAGALFEEVVLSGGIEATDERIVTDGELHDAFELLTSLDLLVVGADGVTWSAVDPSAVSSRVVAPLSQEGAAMLSESARWAQAFQGLSATWRRSPSPRQGPFQELNGIETINRFIKTLVDDAERELLTAQPSFGRSPGALRFARERDIEALERGLTMRTLYQHAARRSRPVAEYVAEVSKHGAEVRTLDEFFARLIVVDRAVAVIPGAVAPESALAVREPSVVAYLVDMFERHWGRARPFSNREVSTLSDIAEEQRAGTIRLLIEGHSDAAACKRLGVSPRTYASYVADLKTEYDAATRFQLGYAMGQLARDQDPS